MTRQPGGQGAQAHRLVANHEQLGLAVGGRELPRRLEHVLQSVGVSPLERGFVLPDDFFAVAAVGLGQEVGERPPPEVRRGRRSTPKATTFFTRVLPTSVAISVMGTSKSRARCPSGELGPDGRVGDDKAARRRARDGCGRSSLGRWLPGRGGRPTSTPTGSVADPIL